MNNLPKEKLKKFFLKYSVSKFKKKETILRAGDNPQGVYYLAKGYLRMYMITGEGNELTLNIFKPGSFFPLSWAITKIPNSYFYESITECEILKVTSEDFQEFIKDDPEVMEEIIRILLLGLNGTLMRLQYMILGNSGQKVCNIFLLLGKRFGDAKNKHIYIKFPITHQEIANLSGLTRETVSIEIKKLENEKLISRRKRDYVINNITKLEKKSLIIIKGNPILSSF
jgi:CRP/FNR family transcriptional regulator